MSMSQDIRTLDLNLLKTLDALLDERSVTGAAKRLSLTQPAVSGMLNRLRECFNDPLFIRNQRGITPTLRAQQLALPVKNILYEINTLLQPQGFDPACAEMTIHIAATDYALKVILLPYITLLRLKAPGIKVAIVPVHNDTVYTALEQGLLDFALISAEMAHPSLHAHALFDENYVCVARHDHPVMKQGNLSIEQFCNLDHALVSHDGGSFYGITDETLRQSAQKRNVVLSVTSFQVLPEVLTKTDLIAVVPSRLVKERTDLVSCQPPIDIPGFSKILVWHARTHQNAAHQWLRQLLFQQCID